MVLFMTTTYADNNSKKCNNTSGITNLMQNLFYPIELYCCESDDMWKRHYVPRSKYSDFIDG